MTEEVWNSLQADNSMTFENGTCAGLVIEEEPTVRARFLQHTASPQLMSDEDTIEGEGSTENATSSQIDADSADVIHRGPQLENAFEGTELLGMSSEPYDQVSVEGCARAADTCTAIKGQVSVAYAGTNEYGVVKVVIERIKGGIEDGSFKDYPDSVALDLSFLSGGRTAQVGGIGTHIQMSSARGTTVPEADEESSYISKYGKLFVSFIGILGVGCFVALAIKRRRRKRREKEMSDTDEEDSFALDVEENIVGDDINKTVEGDSSSSSPPPQNQEGRPVNISSPNNLSQAASASDEVEISLPSGIGK